LNAGSIRTIYNLGLYALLLDQDIAFFTDDLVTAIGEQRRQFVAKHEALLLYEAAEDLPQLLGRDFRDAVSQLGASSEQMSRVNAVSSELNGFWLAKREFLGTIRNALAAHRDHDALQYSETLETLKPLEVMAAAAELSQRLEDLVAVITDLVWLTGGAATVLKDMAASRNTTKPQGRSSKRRH
jgi:hypothetical protein